VDTPGAWSAMAAAAGVRTTDITPAVSVTNVQRWEIEAGPEYAPLREGRASAEDDSPFVEALNRVVGSGDLRQVNRLFGTAQPIRATWTFEAVDLTTGERVPVHEGAGAPPNQVQVEVGPETGLTTNISVVFPQEPADTVFELTATASMRDTFGVEGETRHRLWSHVLTHDDARELAQSMVITAASLAGIEPDELVFASELGEPTIDGINDEPRVPNLRSSRATTVRLMAMAASEDQRVTVDELRSLIRGAMAFGEAT
jgi:hypothetical protein